MSLPVIKDLQVNFDLTDDAVKSKIKSDLYAFSYFDTPSTSRHHHGDLYLEKGVSYIDLGFQIRLKTLLFRTNSLDVSGFINQH